MNPVLTSNWFARVAAMAEIILVLALGNIIGIAIYESILPKSVAEGNANPILINFYAGLRIFLRIGITSILGFGLLYFRRRITPRQAGLTRNRKSLLFLVQKGFVLGIFTAFFVALLFSVHDLLPFGQGLASWWTYHEKPIDLAFAIELLATSIFVPPLMEEIMSRGYNRTRLVESYGVMAGVILTGVFFALAHTRYLQADAMLLAFMGTVIISSISWTYLAQKTGSIIPSIVAHAMTNGIATAILFDVWLPSALVTILFLILIKPIGRQLKEFRTDWVADEHRSSLWFGIGFIALVFSVGLALLPVLGRTQVLISIGVLMLIITITNLLVEKTRNPR